MKRIFLILLVSSEIFERTKDPQLTAIFGRLELSVVESTKFGKLMSITTHIENRSDHKLYLDGILPLLVHISKERNGKYEDYTQGWIYDEIHNENRNAISSDIGQTLYQERGCEMISDVFIDPFVSNFFNDQLLNKDLIKTKQDSLDLRFWICFQFRSLLYLEPRETVDNVKGINSLPKGSYKIYFTYSNKNDYARKVSPYERFKKFQLPHKLNGFERWRGEIMADTLYLHVK